MSSKNKNKGDAKSDSANTPPIISNSANENNENENENENTDRDNQFVTVKELRAVTDRIEAKVDRTDAKIDALTSVVYAFISRFDGLETKDNISRQPETKVDNSAVSLLNEFGDDIEESQDKEEDLSLAVIIFVSHEKETCIVQSVKEEAGSQSIDFFISPGHKQLEKNVFETVNKFGKSRKTFDFTVPTNIMRESIVCDEQEFSLVLVNADTFIRSANVESSSEIPSINIAISDSENGFTPGTMQVINRKVLAFGRTIKDSVSKVKHRPSGNFHNQTFGDRQQPRRNSFLKTPFNSSSKASNVHSVSRSSFYKDSGSESESGDSVSSTETGNGSENNLKTLGVFELSSIISRKPVNGITYVQGESHAEHQSMTLTSKDSLAQLYKKVRSWEQQSNYAALPLHNYISPTLKDDVLEYLGRNPDVYKREPYKSITEANWFKCKFQDIFMVIVILKAPENIADYLEQLRKIVQFDTTYWQCTGYRLTDKWAKPIYKELLRFLRELLKAHQLLTVGVKDIFWLKIRISNKLDGMITALKHMLPPAVWEYFYDQLWKPDNESWFTSNFTGKQGFEKLLRWMYKQALKVSPKLDEAASTLNVSGQKAIAEFGKTILSTVSTPNADSQAKNTGAFRRPKVVNHFKASEQEEVIPSDEDEDHSATVVLDNGVDNEVFELHPSGYSDEDGEESASLHTESRLNQIIGRPSAPVRAPRAQYYCPIQALNDVCYLKDKGCKHSHDPTAESSYFEHVLAKDSPLRRYLLKKGNNNLPPQRSAESKKA